MRKLAGLILIAVTSGCSDTEQPCALDKSLILEGNGSLQIQSQWDACIANNAGLVRKSKQPIEVQRVRLTQLCEPFGDQYVQAIMSETPKLSRDQAEQTKAAYADSIKKMAASELTRVESGDCSK